MRNDAVFFLFLFSCLVLILYFVCKLFQVENFKSDAVCDTVPHHDMKIKYPKYSHASYIDCVLNSTHFTVTGPIRRQTYKRTNEQPPPLGERKRFHRNVLKKIILYSAEKNFLCVFCFTGHVGYILFVM